MNRIPMNDNACRDIPMNTTARTRFQRCKKALVLFLSASLALMNVPVYAGTVVTYVHTDHLGSPVAETDSLGHVISRQSYTPYGESYQHADPDGPGFTGHRNDSDTGLVYMQARYYDPVIGQFLSVDPVTFAPNQPQFFNRYWYANGNPYKYTDPDGRCAAVVACAVGVLILGTITMVAFIEGVQGTQKAFENADNVMNNEEGSDPNEGRQDRPLDQPVDLEEDLAGQEIAGKMRDGSDDIKDFSEGMNEDRFQSGEASKLRGNHKHPDGTLTEVHGVRDNSTGEVDELKFKDRDNARSRGNREREKR